MLTPNLPEPELLKAILQPLLDDFLYWFDRSRRLLQTEEVSFLTAEEKDDLLARIDHAEQEVRVSQTLFQLTGGGVETKVLIPWHQLLTECWHVAMRFRMEQSQAKQ